MFGRILALVARCLAPTLLSVLLVWGVSRLWLVQVEALSAGELMRLLAASVTFAGVYVLLALPFVRGIGFRSLAIESNLPILSGLARRLTRGMDGNP